MSLTERDVDYASAAADGNVGFLPSEENEYAAIASHVGLIDRSYLSKVKLVGHDCLDLLQRISTNDLTQLTTGNSVRTILTTEKGKVLDLVSLYKMSDQSLLLLSHAPASAITQWIDRFIVLEDVKVTDVTHAYGLLTLLGPNAQKALELASQARDEKLASIAKVIETTTEGMEIVIGPPEHSRWVGFNILVEARRRTDLEKRLLETGRAMGLIRCSSSVVEAHRIERGIPLYGKELTQDVNPLEAGLHEYVSYTKGCYVGQEVIARLHTYQKVQKRLMGIIINERVGLPLGSKVRYKEIDAGLVTSVAFSPRVGGMVALVYLRAQCAEAETEVSLGSGTRTTRGRLVELPIRTKVDGDYSLEATRRDKATVYKATLSQLESLLAEDDNLIASLANTSALLKVNFSSFSWVGFYFATQGDLVLGPFQGKPACVRIRFGRGVCGAAAQRKEAIIVEDVTKFPGHIACDPLSRSEIVIPILNAGTVLGVLDVDSENMANFDQTDKVCLEDVVGLLKPKFDKAVLVVG